MRCLRQFADGFFQQRPGLLAVFAFPFGVEAGGAQLFPERRDASGWLNVRPLAASSCCRPAFSLATSARSLTAAALMFLATMVLHVLRQLLPGAAVGQEPEAVPHVVGQRAVLLHLVELCGRDDRQRIFLALDDLGLQRGIDLAEIDRGGGGVERLEHRGPERRHRHADLEALVDRPAPLIGLRRRCGLAESVVPDLVHDHEAGLR